MCVLSFLTFLVEKKFIMKNYFLVDRRGDLSLSLSFLQNVSSIDDAKKRGHSRGVSRYRSCRCSRIFTLIII